MQALGRRPELPLVRHSSPADIDMDAAASAETPAVAEGRRLCLEFDTILDSLSERNRDTLLQWLPDSDRLRFAASWSVIFHSSAHGCNSGEFHRRCDGKAPTLMVARLKDGLIIGGFTVIPWQSTSGDTFTADTAAFLFSLTGPTAGTDATTAANDSLAPIQQHRQTGSDARSVCHTNPQTYGPAFGYDVYFKSDLQASFWSCDKAYRLPAELRARQSGSANVCVLMEVWCAL